MKLNIANDGIGFGKNIMDVRVPKKLRTRIKSGIKFIDDALGGEGFTPQLLLSLQVHQALVRLP